MATIQTLKCGCTLPTEVYCQQLSEHEVGVYCVAHDAEQEVVRV